ncbi:uracil-DNA glycosylase [Lutimonas sp.]|uniref:uracil-DNA glycosylase n=1 Tax=Lutimonas sp. TaxID=1872403 RepID=UPI003D9BB0FE
MNVNISNSWKSILADEFKKDYFKSLEGFVETEYENYRCFPESDHIFAAFNHCDFEAVKVVVIGQDPYHGEGQANGLCFSVKEQVKHPPSLVNIFKELEADLGKPYPISGDLNDWASQGVLLLNATLTVRSGAAGSHQKKGWEKFTDVVIEQLSEKREHLVFLLWGGFAQKKGKKINDQRHQILDTGHPSPLSANRGYWFGNKHFSKANEYLRAHQLDEISW